jgi:hypothetical protein
MMYLIFYHYICIRFIEQIKRTMKKLVLKSFVMSVVLMTSVSANAQISLGNLGDAIGKVVGGDVASVISGNNNVTAETLAGTWSYQQPAVEFESSNLLKKAGGKIASATIEKKLVTQFAKVGITAGKFMMTFNADGTFAAIKNGQTSTSGKYTISGEKIIFSYLEGAANVTGYAQIQDGVLSITFDSSKLLDVVSKVGSISSNSSLSTIGTLAKSFDGMKSGMKFTKYVAPVEKTTTVKSKTSSKNTSKKKSTKKRKK